jgi:hypothetical protein
LFIQTRIGFGLVNPGQTHKVVGITMRDQNAVDLFGLCGTTAAIAVGQITGKQLIIACIYQHHLALGRLDD